MAIYWEESRSKSGKMVSELKWLKLSFPERVCTSLHACKSDLQQRKVIC